MPDTTLLTVSPLEAAELIGLYVRSLRDFSSITLLDSSKVHLMKQTVNRLKALADQIEIPKA